MSDPLDDLFRKMTILPDAEYQQQIKEPNALLVCAPASSSNFADDIIGACSICSTPICYRPYNETATNKLCINCILSIL